MEQLLKYTPPTFSDYEDLQKATQKVNSVVEVINKGRKQLETFHKASFLQIEIERALGKDFQLLKVGRFFIREGDFQKIANGKELLQRLYLFSDILIYGKIVNPGKKEKFKYKGHMYLAKMKVEQLEESELTPKMTNNTAFKIVRLDGKEEKKYILVAKSKEEKYLWENEFRDLIKDLVGSKNTYTNTGNTSMDLSMRETSELDSVKKRDIEERIKLWRQQVAKANRKERNLRENDQRVMEMNETRDDMELFDKVELTGSDENFPPFHRMHEGFGPHYSTLVDIASQLGQQKSTEFLILGESTSAKSFVFDSIVGLPLLSGIPTGTVVHFRMKSNPVLEEPKIVLKTSSRTIYLRTVDDLRLKLAEKVVKKRKEPIYVTYESRSCWNVTVIDTPTLNFEADETIQTVVQLTSHPERVILCVEPTTFAPSTLFDFVKQNVDPTFSRTFFVRTKFNLFTELMTTPGQLDTFFKQIVGLDNSFFLPGFSKQTRQKISSANQLEQRLLQTNVRQKTILDSLETPSGNVQRVGLVPLRKRLTRLVFQRDMDKVISSIPTMLGSKLSSLADTLKRLQEKESELQSVSIPSLRQVLARSSSRFHKVVDELLAGSVSLSPPTTGHSLGQEKHFNSTGYWAPPILVPVAAHENLPVPFRECALGPGGAQLQRLLEEFKLVSLSLEMDVSRDLLIPHPDKSRQAEVSHQLAEGSLRRMWRPVILELAHRLHENVQHLADLAYSITASHIQLESLASPLHRFDLERYTHVDVLLKQHLSELGHKLALNWAEDVLEDLQCERFPSWGLHKIIAFDFVPSVPQGQVELLSLKTERMSVEEEQETLQKVVLELAQRLFAETKGELTRKALMHLHEHFVVPITSPNFLHASIHSVISLLPEKEVHSLFDVHHALYDVRQEISLLEKHISNWNKQKQVFNDLLQKFYPVRQHLLQ